MKNCNKNCEMWSNLSVTSINPRDAQLYGPDVYSIVNPDALNELSKETKDMIKRYRIENNVKKEISQPLNEFISLTDQVKKSFKCFCGGGQIKINNVIGVDKYYIDLMNKVNNFYGKHNKQPIPRSRFTSFLNIELFLLLEHLSPTDTESKAKICVFNQVITPYDHLDAIHY